jgi:hypothetical protein
MKIEFGKGLFGRGLPPPENLINHYDPPSVRLPSTQSTLVAAPPHGTKY